MTGGHDLRGDRRSWPPTADYCRGCEPERRRRDRSSTAEFGTDLIMSMIVGLAVPHFHQHAFVRHPGTPGDLPWFRSGEWSGAPQRSAAELAALAERLAAHTDA
jgi:hypothetical protein